jgi:membrane protease YdiL (CAAX protease family)
MEKQREINSMGIVYIIMLLGNIIISTVALALHRFGINVPSIIASVLCEIVVLLPTIIYLKSKGENIPEKLGFHKIKISTVLLTILLTLAVTPIATFANALSQLFVKNIVVQSSGEMIEGSVAMTLIVVSVLAPICEEIAFRGFLFNGIKGISSVIKAVFISSLLFGLLHLNLNQFCYAVVLGVIFALVNQASGSTWTSVIMHFVYNMINIVVLIIATLSMREQNIDYAQAQEAARQAGALRTIMVYGALSVVCVFLVWLLLKAIAKNQGNLESFKNILARKNIQDAESDVRVHSFLNAPMMLSTFIGIVAMIVYQVSGV